MKKYNALIREYSGRSLNVLARVMIADIKDFPEDWQIRYDSKNIDNSTTDIGDLCCGPLNPLQIYKPAKESFPISVRTLSGKCLDIEASKQDTVDVLKIKIFQKDDTLAPNLQKLYFHGNENPKGSLRVWRTLNSYKIRPGSTLFLKRKTTLPFLEDVGQTELFRQLFLPINVEASYQKPLQAENVPLWAKYSPGINFCGICPDSGCISKTSGINEGKVVGHIISYGTTRLDLHQHPLECPACSTSGFEVASFLVYSARVVIRYKSTTPEENGVQRTVVSMSSEFFNEVGMEVKMNFLEITSVEPWRSPYSCMGCDAKIALKSEEVPMRCGHVYHTWCQSKSGGCRVCDSNVLIAGTVKDVLSAFRE